MNILITGCAGFIGFSLANKLLKKNKVKIFGIDNLNKYYSLKLKKKRLSILKKKKNFSFKKIDLTNKNDLLKFFKLNKIDIVYNLAAQAGVRYVKTQPEKFIESNILGFHNLIDVSRNFKINKFYYASSSSIYGDKNKYPVNENSYLDPKNIYGLSKKFNEEYIKINSNKKTKYIGLRFFTVYGEWGRPDMLILKFLDHAKKNKKFFLNNAGKHWRDFTYIDDVVNVLEKLLSKKVQSNTVFNICSNKPIYIKQLINYLSKKVNFYNIKNIKKNDIEVFKTHGQNAKILKFIKYKKFSDFYTSVDKTIDWYKKNNHLI